MLACVLAVYAMNSAASLRVLIVEDEALILMSAVDILGELGHTPLSASNGAGALKILGSAEPIDVMIVDINLPDTNGTYLAIEARRMRPGLPVIFATGYRMGVPDELAATGPTAVLAKPYWSADLDKAIRQVR